MASSIKVFNDFLNINKPKIDQNLFIDSKKIIHHITKSKFDELIQKYHLIQDTILLPDESFHEVSNFQQINQYLNEIENLYKHCLQLFENQIPIEPLRFYTDVNFYKGKLLNLSSLSQVEQLNKKLSKMIKESQKNVISINTLSFKKSNQDIILLLSPTVSVKFPYEDIASFNISKKELAQLNNDLMPNKALTEKIIKFASRSNCYMSNHEFQRGVSAICAHHNHEFLPKWALALILSPIFSILSFCFISYGFVFAFFNNAVTVSTLAFIPLALIGWIMILIATYGYVKLYQENLTIKMLSFPAYLTIIIYGLFILYFYSFFNLFHAILYSILVGCYLLDMTKRSFHWRENLHYGFHLIFQMLVAVIMVSIGIRFTWWMMLVFLLVAYLTQRALIKRLVL